jgi:hypothetical protein
VPMMRTTSPIPWWQKLSWLIAADVFLTNLDPVYAKLTNIKGPKDVSTSTIRSWTRISVSTARGPVCRTVGRSSA